MTVIDGGQVFGLPLPSCTDSGHIHLNSPVTVSFDLPRGATRFVVMAELDVGVDIPERAWADMELVIRNGCQVRVRYRINALMPSAVINLPLRDTRLTIELDSGISGPVMDRLRLRCPIVFVENE